MAGFARRAGHRLAMALASGILLLATSAQALTLGFDNVTANDLGDAAIGEAQLSVEVSDLGGGQALFRFVNAGPEASSITDVYFDDNASALSGLASIDDSGSGVSFSANATPSNLPGGAGISFLADYSADSDSPIAALGVNPGEWLGIAMNLTGSYADLEAALLSGGVRIGIHVQAFASQGSESFVTKPIPEPASMAFFGLGSVVVGAAVRKRVA